MSKQNTFLFFPRQLIVQKPAKLQLQGIACCNGDASKNTDTDKEFFKQT